MVGVVLIVLSDVAQRTEILLTAQAMESDGWIPLENSAANW